MKYEFKIDSLFQKGPLIPVIVQDSRTREVLMLGFSDREAVEKTLETGTAWFWSRSRRALWNKGETSGNFLHVEKILVDCDEDTLLLLCRPDGPTCHTGNQSCFFRIAAEFGG
ncbi:phosphoribosyl-AMP cyclohydrolase [Papillibacter cinnamivorans]|uniref:Histidine biosynthesis bifunctional protein HisIE n=1 Tax=Papillibacter cinnamivorans DSM 12816 TaxID=1122930 RepID=A0A1W1YM00_9FIRM|nr:phosphoribosyl-AMP cyclohydrolase [Papillibacter cinnamivorans]SMC37174.1 phosphoribosyl-AMP cyclohydrolase [Papillibacter cinnamivorans DSM 12816]